MREALDSHKRHVEVLAGQQAVSEEELKGKNKRIEDLELMLKARDAELNQQREAFEERVGLLERSAEAEIGGLKASIDRVVAQMDAMKVRVGSEGCCKLAKVLISL
jgi:hypothetical protein